jgi:hypothetical protein
MTVGVKEYSLHSCKNREGVCELVANNFGMCENDSISIVSFW